MEMPVLIEPVEGGYKAVAGAPFQIAVAGATREEVLEKVRTGIEEKLRGGAEVLRLEVSLGQETRMDNPWLRLAGMYENDPLFDEWQQAIAEYRDQVEKDPDYR